MKRLLLCLVLALMLAGCASQYSQHTKADLSYTEDGRPIFSLDNNKSYNDLKIDVKRNPNGSYEFHYSAKRTDANGAIEAVAKSNASLANTLGGIVKTGVAIVGAP